MGPPSCPRFLNYFPQKSKGNMQVTAKFLDFMIVGCDVGLTSKALGNMDILEDSGRIKDFTEAMGELRSLVLPMRSSYSDDLIPSPTHKRSQGKIMAKSFDQRGKFTIGQMLF
ncbi:hypothetical protein TNCV_2140711 [Trichonephila clavipes]|uniref:Uncharacterized protein n=1 Tax=Trichonephila clavipes TaxID=2585209 RepID=A0A8X6RRZ6_TRICX|nr:hypothetical protein TNCV_2140711 [Trichonephila clavipes]